MYTKLIIGKVNLNKTNQGLSKNKNFKEILPSPSSIKILIKNQNKRTS